MLTNLPEYMRQRRQWCVSYKEDKAPYQPNGMLASPTDPATWSSFEDCVAAVQTGRFTYVGYCISHDDGLSCIDLDGAWPPSAMTPEQWEMFRGFDSYTEFSKSETGLHIWVWGKAGYVVNHDIGVEVYDSQRYIISTGNVLPHNYHADNQWHNDRKTWIEDCQTRLAQAVGYFRLTAGKPLNGIPHDMAPTLEDAEVIRRLRKAMDGNPRLLWRAQYGYGPQEDKSEADAEVAGHIAGFTASYPQAVRVFRELFPHMWRPEKRRGNVTKYVDDYLRRTFGYAFAFEREKQDANKINVEQVKANVAQMLANKGIEHNNLAPVNFPTDSLVGRLADYLYKGSKKPVREIALGTSIAVLAGITGRAFYLENLGLNQYVAVLADSGVGKTSGQGAINTLLTAVADFEQPEANIGKLGGATFDFIEGSVASGPGLHAQMFDSETHSYCSFLGEFGHILKRLTDGKDGTNDTELRGKLLELYTLSGQGFWLRPRRNKKQEESLGAVYRPALSFLGDSTTELFYRAVAPETVAEGFLSRMLVIEYEGDAVYTQKHPQWQPPPDLVEDMAKLMHKAHRLCTDKGSKFERVGYDSQATEAAMDQYDRRNVDIQNAKRKEGSKAEAILWSRVTERVKKLAALNAVGRNWESPQITMADIAWSQEIVERGMARYKAHEEAGDIGSPVQGQMAAIQKAMADYFKLPDESLWATYRVKPEVRDRGIIPLRYFQIRMRKYAAFQGTPMGPDRAISIALLNAVDAGVIGVPTSDQTDAVGMRGGKAFVPGDAA